MDSNPLNARAQYPCNKAKRGNKMTESSADRGRTEFFILWIGQVISMIGSGLSSFSLSLWIYQRTSSITQFALLNLCFIIPGVLFAPLIGALVDRWNRRRIMIFCNLALCFLTLVISALVSTESAGIWRLCPILVVGSIVVSLHGLSFNAVVTLLLSGKDLGRASGMMQFG